VQLLIASSLCHRVAGHFCRRVHFLWSGTVGLSCVPDGHPAIYVARCDSFSTNEIRVTSWESIGALVTCLRADEANTRFRGWALLRGPLSCLCPSHKALSYSCILQLVSSEISDEKSLYCNWCSPRKPSELRQADNLICPFRAPNAVAQQLRMDVQELEAQSTTVETHSKRENMEDPGPSGEGGEDKRQHERKWVATRETFVRESPAEKGIESLKDRAQSSEGGPDLVSRRRHYLSALLSYVSRPRNKMANLRTDSLLDSFLSFVMSDV